MSVGLWLQFIRNSMEPIKNARNDYALGKAFAHDFDRESFDLQRLWGLPSPQQMARVQYYPVVLKVTTHVCIQ
jgi:hypothetical protein